jgi:ATP-dependent Lhr-like helicase
VNQPSATKASATEWTTAIAQQLLARHGIVTRETTASEGIVGGFSGVYQVLKAMEDAGRVRRGYFVAGLGGAQFAMPRALDQLRSLREPPDEPRAVILAATIRLIHTAPRSNGRSVKAAAARHVRRARSSFLVDGFLAAYLRRGERELLLFAREDEPQRSRLIRATARALAELSRSARNVAQRDRWSARDSAPCGATLCRSRILDDGDGTAAPPRARASSTDGSRA